MFKTKFNASKTTVCSRSSFVLLQHTCLQDTEGAPEPFLIEYFGCGTSNFTL